MGPHIAMKLRQAGGPFEILPFAFIPIRHKTTDF